MSKKEKIVNLGTLAGPIKNGSASLPGFREDKRNRVTPGQCFYITLFNVYLLVNFVSLCSSWYAIFSLIKCIYNFNIYNFGHFTKKTKIFPHKFFSLFSVTYLNYGPFSSYCPIFDSTTANLSREDSDLLLSTYGDETGIQYSKR